MRRLGRFVVRALVGVGLLLVVLAVATLVVVRSDVGQATIRDRLVALLEEATGASVSIGRVDGTLLRAVRLSNVSLSAGASRLHVADARLNYSLPALWRGELRFGRVRLTGVRLRAVRTEAGWGLGATSQTAPVLRVRRLQIEDARLAVGLEDTGPARRVALDDLDAELALAVGPGGQYVQVRRLAFRPRGVAITPVKASGEVTIQADGRFVVRDARVSSARTLLFGSADLLRGGAVSGRLSAAPVSAREMRVLAPAVRLTRDLTVHASAQGSWEAIRTTFALTVGAEGGGGEVSGEATLDASTTPVGVTAAMAVERLALGVLAGVPPGRAEGTATLGGHVRDLAYGADLTVTFAAAEAVPVEVGVQGRVAVGAPHEAEFSVAAGPATVGGLDGVSGRAKGALRGERLTVTSAEVSGRGLSATGDALVDLAARRVRAGVDATADLERLGSPATGAAVLRLTADGPWAALPVDGTLVVADPAGASGSLVRLSASGRVSDARFGGRVTTLDVEPATGMPWRLVRPAAVSVDGRALESEPLRLQAGRQQASVGGRVDWAGPLAVTSTWAGVDARPLCEAFGGRACDGVLEGTATLGGTPAAPRLQLDASVPRLALGPADLGQVTATASLAGNVLTADVRADVPGAGDVRLAGTAAVRLGAGAAGQRLGDVDVALTADRLDLGVLQALVPREVKRSDGVLTADLRLRGPWTSARPSGFVEVTASRLELRATGVAYEAVRLRLRAAAGGRLVVETLEARTRAGRLRGEGDLLVADPRAVQARLRLQLDEFQAISVPSYEAVLTGALALEGDVRAPRLTGDVTLTHAVVRPSLLPTSVPEQKPDPTITVVGRPAGVEADEPAPRESRLDAVALGVNVTLGRNVWVRRLDAQIELEGQVRLDRESHGPLRATGRVRSVRGWYAFQGRRFTLEAGEVRFSGETPPDPALAARARHRAGEYTIWATVGGTLSTPSLRLASDPSLSEADVLAVLLFGRPASELGTGEQVALHERAVGLAAGYVMPEVRASVLETLHLDELDVSGEAVTVGRYLTDDVFLSLSQEFGATAGQTMGVEYRLRRDTSVRLSTSTRGNSAVDLIWQKRY
jgi:translocation and assembly module TamB